MQKRMRLAPLLAALALLLCGCAAPNPLASMEATAVPGLSATPHPAVASERGASETVATLYFRYLDQPMLAAENRTLRVKRDESAELAVVNALLEGPSAGNTELVRLFPQTVRAESVRADGGVLVVTLNDALLTGDGVPADWPALPQWQQEAPLRRMLTIQSLAATLTESFPYASVQVMVRQQDGARTTMRLDNSYFLTELAGVSDPIRRDERYLLTPHNTAVAILDAYARRDYPTLYQYVAARSGEAARPIYDRFAAEMDGMRALQSAEVSAGSVSGDGQSALMTADLIFLRDGGERLVAAYPLRLMRENGVWKIAYDALTALAAQ